MVGLEKGLLNLRKNIASLDSDLVTSYALYILIGLLFYILILTFGSAGMLDGFLSYTDVALSMLPIWVYPNAERYQQDKPKPLQDQELLPQRQGEREEE